MTACVIRIPVQYFLDRSSHRCCDFVYVDMPARAGHERLHVVGGEGKCRVLDRQPKSEVIAPSEPLTSDSVYISREDALAAIKTLPQCQPPIASTPQKRR